MKIEAAKRLAARDTKVLNLTITCSGDTYTTLVNLLGVIQWNCGVGHSATVGAFFDGDGADQMTIEGLPEGEYQAIAEAISSYGDDVAAIVGPNSGSVWNTVTEAGPDTKMFRKKQVYPNAD